MRLRRRLVRQWGGAHLGFIRQQSCSPGAPVQHTEYKLWISQRLTRWTSLLPSLPGLPRLSCSNQNLPHFLPTQVNFIARSFTPRPASPAVSFMVLCVILICKKWKLYALKMPWVKFGKFWKKIQKILLGFKMSASFKARLWNDYFSKNFFVCLFFILLILKSLIRTCVPKHEPPSHLPPQKFKMENSFWNSNLFCFGTHLQIQIWNK